MDAEKNGIGNAEGDNDVIDNEIVADTGMNNGTSIGTIHYNTINSMESCTLDTESKVASNKHAKLNDESYITRVRRSQRKRNSKSMPVIYPPSDDEEDINDVHEEDDDEDESVEDGDDGEADEVTNMRHRQAICPPRNRRSHTTGNKASHHGRSAAPSVRRAQSVSSVSSTSVSTAATSAVSAASSSSISSGSGSSSSYGRVTHKLGLVSGIGHPHPSQIKDGEKTWLICRHICGCKRRGSDSELLSHPRPCSSRGARYDHETNTNLHPNCSTLDQCYSLITTHSPRKRMFVNQHPAPNASLTEQIKHVHERQEIPSRRMPKHDTHHNNNNNNNHNSSAGGDDKEHHNHSAKTGNGDGSEKVRGGRNGNGNGGRRNATAKEKQKKHSNNRTGASADDIDTDTVSKPIAKRSSSASTSLAASDAANGTDAGIGTGTLISSPHQLVSTSLQGDVDVKAQRAFPTCDVPLQRERSKEASSRSVFSFTRNSDDLGISNNGAAGAMQHIQGELTTAIDITESTLYNNLSAATSNHASSSLRHFSQPNSPTDYCLLQKPEFQRGYSHGIQNAQLPSSVSLPSSPSMHTHTHAQLQSHGNLNANGNPVQQQQQQQQIQRQYQEGVYNAHVLSYSSPINHSSKSPRSSPSSHSISLSHHSSPYLSSVPHPPISSGMQYDTNFVLPQQTHPQTPPYNAQQPMDDRHRNNDADSNMNMNMNTIAPASTAATRVQQHDSLPYLSSTTRSDSSSSAHSRDDSCRSSSSAVPSLSSVANSQNTTVSNSSNSLHNQNQSPSPSSQHRHVSASASNTPSPSAGSHMDADADADAEAHVIPQRLGHGTISAKHRLASDASLNTAWVAQNLQPTSSNNIVDGFSQTASPMSSYIAASNVGGVLANMQQQQNPYAALLQATPEQLLELQQLLQTPAAHEITKYLSSTTPQQLQTTQTQMQPQAQAQQSTTTYSNYPYAYSSQSSTTNQVYGMASSATRGSRSMAAPTLAVSRQRSDSSNRQSIAQSSVSALLSASASSRNSGHAGFRTPSPLPSGVTFDTYSSNSAYFDGSGGGSHNDAASTGFLNRMSSSTSIDFASHKYPIDSVSSPVNGSATAPSLSSSSTPVTSKQFADIIQANTSSSNSNSNNNENGRNNHLSLTYMICAAPSQSDNSLATPSMPIAAST